MEKGLENNKGTSAVGSLIIQNQAESPGKEALPKSFVSSRLGFFGTFTELWIELMMRAVIFQHSGLEK